MNAFITGTLAGYGIAIPVGAIAILIIDVGLRDGFRNGFWAGAGAASADLLYATVAVVLGGVAATALGRFEIPLKTLSGSFLLALGVVGIWKLHNRRPPDPASPNVRAGAMVYIQFLGLTLLNPMTVVYFAALILGGAAGSVTTYSSRILFILGAGIASLSWQTLLAASASVLHKQLTDGPKRMLSLAGNAIICAFGIDILAGAISAISNSG